MAIDRELSAMATVLETMEGLEPDERERVLAWVASRLDIEARQSSPIAPEPGGKRTPIDSVKDFLKAKRPANDVARVTALAYYLSEKGGQATYKTSDLSKARIDAALARFNVSRAVSHAQRAGYMTTAARRGSYQITAHGEALVEAMPDATTMQQAALAFKRRRTSVAGSKATKPGGAQL
jgi:restriction endonuclease Mrr